jgi:hypothetical protein
VALAAAARRRHHEPDLQVRRHGGRHADELVVRALQLAATPALLAQSADQLTPRGRRTRRRPWRSRPRSDHAAGVYYAAIMVKATTPPTLVGANLGIAGAGASILSSKVLAQTSGSALTTTAPATIASGTTIATVPLVVADLISRRNLP